MTDLKDIKKSLFQGGNRKASVDISRNFASPINTHQPRRNQNSVQQTLPALDPNTGKNFHLPNLGRTHGQMTPGPQRSNGLQDYGPDDEKVMDLLAK